ncbi:nose resistant to fluoxetine protein 6-like isoform X2 [Biomphalaria glabrata]|uniref:Nose resistant to fluoxetine protein 6-like isoform X2 n=1 Tax=Biomphalaria glabrata TaxID=6526 RepID=A0A9W2Z2H6_BIOGL|nr:nose resistant to fluoxetine protein 6-like isoform X2 [Biomphalaria glabrata]
MLTTSWYLCLVYLSALCVTAQCSQTLEEDVRAPRNMSENEQINDTRYASELARWEKIDPASRDAALRTLNAASSQVYSLKYNVTDMCGRHLRAIAEGLKKAELWALAFLDSSGILDRSSDLDSLQGLGSYDLCESIGSELLSESLVSSRYIELIFIIYNMRLQIDWYVCLPKACGQKDLENISKSFIEYVDLKGYAATYVTFNQKPSQDNSFVIAIVVISLLVCLCIAGTITEYFTLQDTEEDELTALVTMNEKESKISLFGLIDHNSAKERVHNVLLSFSVRKSLSTVLKTDYSDGDIKCLNGLRVLSMMWVVFGHTSNFIPKGRKDKEEYTFEFIFYLFCNAPFAVDSFFLLSGCLVSYIFITKIKAIGYLTASHMIQYYSHRYLRLTPLFALTILIHTGLSPYLGNGPMAHYVEQSKCQLYWWRNLLYISNLYSYNDLCVPWTWYMPNDMQFYAIAPLFTIPIVYGFVRLGLLTAGLMVACHFVSTIYTIYHGDFLTREDARENYLTHIYIKPWTRIGPYAIGLVLGFLMTVLNSDFKMSKKALFTGWLVTSAFVVPMFFFQDGGHTRHLTIITDLNQSGVRLLEIVKSPLWGLFVAWLVFSCHYGYGGVVNTFLSWNAWIPLSRLTYGAYLFHLMITLYLNQSQAYEVYFTKLYAVFRTTTVIVMAYFVSLVVSVLSEMPIRNLITPQSSKDSRLKKMYKRA